MTGLLKDRIRIIIFRLQVIRIMPFIRFSRPAGDDWIHGILFVWSPDMFRASHGDTVVIARSALRTHDVIVVPPFRQMGSLDAAPVRASAPDPFYMALNFLLLRIIFHHADLARLLVAFPGLPLQRHHILFPVVVMEQGCVKSCGI